MSDLEFAAYGFSFLKIYVKKKLPLYIIKLKLAQVDSNHSEKQRGLFRSWQNKITVNHVSLLLGLLDYYDILSKAQHGASTVNQLPWEFYDKVQVIEKKLALLLNTE